MNRTRSCTLTCALTALALTAPAAHAGDGALVPGASYVVDALSVVDGGASRGSALLGRGDLTLDIAGAAAGIHGLTLHFDLMVTHRSDFSGERVGDAQTVSNVQADSPPRLFEAFAEWEIAPGLAAKAGLIDLNSEFDVQDAGGLFLNSSHGIGPDFAQSGRNGPSIFPVTSSAIILRRTRGDTVLRAGLFDAISGGRDDPRHTVLRWPGQTGALLVAEGRTRIGKTTVALGGWHYTTRFDSIDPSRPAGRSEGVYALVEGPLAQGVTGWVRAGLASGRTNPISSYVGGGLVTEWGAWQTGLALAHARLGRDARSQVPGAHRAETAIELTAARQVLPFLSVQPDAQYVIHPSWNPALPDALVLGLRLSFAWPAS